MSYDYIDKQIDTIFAEKEYEYPLNAAMAATWIASFYKGSDLKILDMSKSSTLADYFVLISAANATQAFAMAETISVQLRKRNLPVRSFEGEKTSDWVLIDEGNIIVHIFVGPSRDLYDLDGLWSMAPGVEIPENIYFSSVPPVKDDMGIRPATFDEYF